MPSAGAVGSPTGVPPVQAPSLTPPTSRAVGLPPSVVSQHKPAHTMLQSVRLPPPHPPQLPPSPHTQPLSKGAEDHLDGAVEKKLYSTVPAPASGTLVLVEAV